MWRPEDSFQASVLSFLRVGLGDLIQVVRPGSKCLVLNHLPKPELKKIYILHVLCVWTSETTGWFCSHRELWDWNSGGQACVKLSAAEPSHWLLTHSTLACVTACADVSVTSWRMRQSRLPLRRTESHPRYCSRARWTWFHPESF